MTCKSSLRPQRLSPKLTVWKPSWTFTTPLQQLGPKSIWVMVSLAQRSSAGFERSFRRFWSLPEAFQCVSAVICSSDSHIALQGQSLKSMACTTRPSPPHPPNMRQIPLRPARLPFFGAGSLFWTRLNPPLQLCNLYLLPGTVMHYRAGDAGA